MTATDAPTGDVGFYGLLAAIMQDHPDIGALLSKPGVLQVALQMEQDEQQGHPWTAAQLQAKMQATEYWRTTDAQQRAWDALQATDPQTAKTKATLTKQTIDDLQSQLGVTLDQTGGFSSPYFQFFTNAVRSGWTADQIKYQMLASVNKTTGGGDLGSAAADIRKQFDDYAVPISDAQVMKYATQLTSGAIDAKALVGYAQQQAESLFPGIQGDLQRGFSVRQIADPYLQIAQQELGINPDTIKLTDPQWSKAINQIDPKTGNKVAMNLSDWTSAIRTDPTYGYDQTTQAKTQAAQLGTRIAQLFGATG